MNADPSIAPVVFIVFRRPNATRRVFKQIQSARPPYLHVVVDAPRPDRPEEKVLCADVLKIIENGVNWNCSLTYDIAKSNMGCGRRVSSGISAAFQRFDRAIILEDDCLPADDFFKYASQALEEYHGNDEVMHISGSVIVGAGCTKEGHRLSRYQHIWGWASWRRAWAHYDFEMRGFNACDIGRRIAPFLKTVEDVEYWKKRFQQVHDQTVDTWDYQWTYACWKRGALSVLPNENLVKNIGFGQGAVHTTEADDPLADRPLGSAKLPFVRNELVVNERLDQEIQETLYRSRETIYRKLRYYYKIRGVSALTSIMKLCLKKILRHSAR